MSEDTYTHQAFWQERILHPSITHINCSKNISAGMVDLINKIVNDINTAEQTKSKQP